MGPAVGREQANVRAHPSRPRVTRRGAVQLRMAVQTVDAETAGGIITRQRHLAAVLDRYTAHYDAHWPHRSLDQPPPTPHFPIPGRPADEVQPRPILVR